EMRKIKVLHIITRLILGGAQENTIFTVWGLNKSDCYEVELATGPPIGPEGSLIEEAKKRGIKLKIMPSMRREINLFRDLLAFIELYLLIRKGKYTIVHTHSSKAGILGRLAARIAGVKIIIHSVHGLPFFEYQNRFLNYIYILCERFAALFTDRLISVCDAMARKAIAAGVAKEDKFTTIYSGIELNHYFNSDISIAEKQKELNLDPDVPVVGNISRLFELKGHNYLLEAASQVVEVFPEAKFLLVGDGILRERLIRQAEDLKIRNNIVFTGLVERKEIPRLISVMDVVVHTSLREGLPRVLPEALAMAKPVIAFEIDGMPEIIKDGENGYLIPPKDSRKLANSIIRLLQDKEKARRMGEAGRGMVNPAFDLEVMVERISDVYKESIEERGGVFKWWH
ncbi:MAG: glycosyltransferase family 4 protein, partial [Elusimicrobiota bacterium]|nr:glycosyltransferase family 4 protein [Elusimicrobiota bacterium]